MNEHSNIPPAALAVVHAELLPHSLLTAIARTVIEPGATDHVYDVNGTSAIEHREISSAQ